MKNITFLLLIVFALSKANAQGFYDINTIQTIEIIFTESNWDALLDAEKAGVNNYTEAASVTINGTVFNSVGVKYKGNSSYSATNNKNPFHIELDTYVDQNYEGFTDIKLANVFADPSFVRETVAYNIVRQYMHAPEANYANVYVNGTLIGLYTNTEAITKKFVDKHFLSNNNAFFSCSPPAGAGPTSTNLPGLEYLGTSSASYDDAYEIKSNDLVVDWDALIELTNTLNNDVANIETVLDVDRAIWMLAFDNVLVNLDSYIGMFKQNYYLYQDDNGRFNSVVWDLNMSFGTFGMTGEAATGGGGGPGGGGPGATMTTTEKSELSHYLHATDSSWPLLQQLLSVPRYEKMYLAHYKTILTENISNNNYLTLANDYQAIIDAAVQADSNKFYTYANFQNNITTDVTAGNNTACGLTNLMSARNTYLSALTDFTNTQPTISNVAPSLTGPLVGTTITIAADVADTNTDAVYLGYRSSETLPFTKVLMYDDGAHGDGAANDNVYGADLTISNIYMQYYIYAENDDIGAFSPARAEHEFYIINATYPTLNVGELVINEIMASNVATEADQDGEYDDWLELYNNTSNTLSLDNLFLSDDSGSMLTWQFPAGTTIAANDYLIVWCDKDETQVGLHAEVKFSAGGEEAILSYADGTILQSITFGAQTDDQGYARVPNGTGSFVIQDPTFNINNETYLSIDDFSLVQEFGVYPNPTAEILNISNSERIIQNIKIHTIQGRLIYESSYANQNQVSIDVSGYTNGLYVVTVNDSVNLKIIKN